MGFGTVCAMKGGSSSLGCAHRSGDFVAIEAMMSGRAGREHQANKHNTAGLLDTQNLAGRCWRSVLGWPEEPMLIRSLATAAVTRPGAIARVDLVGSPARPRWQQTADGLRVDLAQISPAADYATALRIHLAV